VKLVIQFAILIVIVSVRCVIAEPFINTKDTRLRADIETLANIGVIRSPINTYPMLWASILKELGQRQLSEIPKFYQSSYARILREGRQAIGKKANHSELNIRVSEENELFRYFGDDQRNDQELTSRTAGMTSHLAWNLEATLAPDSVDGEEKRFDGTYFAAVTGNWVFSIGKVERWWGPGMQHSIILSNNAAPVSALTIQRNYTDPFETRLLRWMGPWTFNAFAGLLDDDRAVDEAKLLGMSFSFVPMEGLEIGLRRTAQWGGKGRPESLDSFLDLLVGNDNCDGEEFSCSGERNEPGNQLAGIDISYRPNWVVPGSIYFQTIGEDEAGYAPSKKSWMYGANLQIPLKKNNLFVNLEQIDTTVDGDGNDPDVPFDGYNVLYEHVIYHNGYRYYGRSLGSTIDNDSSALSLRVLYSTSNYGRFNFVASRVKLNEDADNVANPGGHSLLIGTEKISEIKINWEYPFQKMGTLGVSLIHRDKGLETKLGDFEKSALGLSWKVLH